MGDDLTAGDKIIIEKLEGLQNRLDKIESRFANQINIIAKNLLSVKDDLKSYQQTTLDKIGTLQKDLIKIEKSQNFISDQFDGNKKVCQNLMKNDKAMANEIKVLSAELRSLKQELKEEKCARNADAQYIRSSYMVEISNIPVLPDEKNAADTKALVIVRELAPVYFTP